MKNVKKKTQLKIKISFEAIKWGGVVHTIVTPTQSTYAYNTGAYMYITVKFG